MPARPPPSSLPLLDDPAMYRPSPTRPVRGKRAREMRPDLVSIAGVYRTAEEPLPADIFGQAATVRLQSTEAGDKLVFSPIAG